jgi:hypothetical protein
LSVLRFPKGHQSQEVGSFSLLLVEVFNLSDLKEEKNL